MLRRFRLVRGFPGGLRLWGRFLLGVPLPDAPGRATPTPAPETVDFVIDEEAMGDLADQFVEATPSPTPALEQTDEQDEDLEMLEDDDFPDNL